MPYQNLVIPGFVVVFIGIILIVIGSFLQAKGEDSKVNVGVGGFIGPLSLDLPLTSLPLG